MMAEEVTEEEEEGKCNKHLGNNDNPTMGVEEVAEEESKDFSWETRRWRGDGVGGAY